MLVSISVANLLSNCPCMKILFGFCRGSVGTIGSVDRSCLEFNVDIDCYSFAIEI